MATTHRFFLGDITPQIDFIMKHQIGTLLQFIALVFLPLVVIGQLNFNFPLIIMPICLVTGIVLFMIGYKLREG